MQSRTTRNTVAALFMGIAIGGVCGYCVVDKTPSEDTDSEPPQDDNTAVNIEKIGEFDCNEADDYCTEVYTYTPLDAPDKTVVIVKEGSPVRAPIAVTTYDKGIQEDQQKFEP